jgi:integrase
MPRIRLTKLAADRLAPPKAGRVIHWDRTLPGFGLRVTAKGAKSWVAMYRVNGKTVMETIGSLAKVTDIGEARDLARASMQKAEAGTHPVEEKRAGAARDAISTVGAAVERYLSEGGRSSKNGPWKPKTAKEWRRIFVHDVLPHWGDRPLAEIAKTDVLALVNDKAATRERKRKGAPSAGAAVQAGKMLTRLRTFFAWAAANDLIGADPTAGVLRPAREAQRDRVLTDDDIRFFWRGAEQLGMPFGPLFQLLLLTAQRETEVAGLRWLEFDSVETPKVWTIPGERAKNRKPHLVHLSDLATEALEQVAHVKGQTLLFSGTGKTPVSGFSNAKERLDELMLRALREQSGDAEAELTPWVLHDLRRTATTGMARLGVAPHVADRVLNHQAGTIRGVAAVYNRFEYLDEREAALEAWGRFVESLVRPVPSNVIQLAATA